MNILFITYKIGGTASGKISARVANELSIKGHKVYVVTESVHDSQKVHEDIILSECRNYIKESSFLSRVRIKILTLLKYSAYNSNFIWRIRAYLKSRDIITNNKIDWIIARTTPIDSCLVGLKLKEKTHIKLYSHFSDPLPPPSEKNKKIRRRFYTETGKIISQSDLISFGTQQMYNYIQSMFEYNFSNKTFVSPDVTDTDNQIELKRDESNNVVKLLFLGNIYGNRNPNELFAAIKEINEKQILACARFNDGLELELPQEIDFSVICNDGIYKTKTILKSVENDEPYVFFILETPVGIEYQQNREYFRVPVKYDCVYRIREEGEYREISAKTADISANGISIVLPTHTISEELSELIININEIQIMTRVRYIRSEKVDNGYRLSFAFVAISDLDRDFISQVCIKKQLEQRRNSIK